MNRHVSFIDLGRTTLDRNELVSMLDERDVRMTPELETRLELVGGAIVVAFVCGVVLLLAWVGS